MKHNILYFLIASVVFVCSCGGINNSGGGKPLNGMTYVFQYDNSVDAITALAWRIDPYNGEHQALPNPPLPPIFGSNRAIGRDIEASVHGHLMVCHFAHPAFSDGRVTAFTADFETGALVQTGEVTLHANQLPLNAQIDNDVIIVCEMEQSAFVAGARAGDAISLIKYDASTGALSHDSVDGVYITYDLPEVCFYLGHSLVIHNDNVYVVGQAINPIPGVTGSAIFLIHLRMDREAGTLDFATQIPFERRPGRIYGIGSRNWRAFAAAGGNGLVIACDQLEDDNSTLFGFNLATDGTPSVAGFYDTGEVPTLADGNPGRPMYYNGRFYCSVPTPQFDTIRAFDFSGGAFRQAPGIPDFDANGEHTWGLFSFRDLIYYSSLDSDLTPNEHIMRAAKITETGELVEAEHCSFGISDGETLEPFFDRFHRQGRLFAVPAGNGTASTQDLRVMTSDLVDGTMADVGTYPLPAGGGNISNLPAIILEPQ